MAAILARAAWQRRVDPPGHPTDRRLRRKGGPMNAPLRGGRVALPVSRERTNALRAEGRAIPPPKL